jgi:arginase family enzyme
MERDELRNLWRDRLEAAWRQVMVDMTEQRPGATTAAVRIATAATNLDGLNAPLMVDVRVTEVFEALVTELVAHDLA